MIISCHNKLNLRCFGTLLLCLAYVLSPAQQDLRVEYNPLKSKGKLPEIFVRPVSETVSAEIGALKDKQDSSNELRSALFTISNYTIDSRIKSGSTLINDEITEYLEDIVDEILKNQPELRKQIHIYTTKSTIANASTFYNGTIFVNLALITHAKNEAQIAFILCHEIMHYTKQHSINGFIHNEQLESMAEGKSSENIFKEKCSYSKDQEIDADTAGLNLLKETRYDINEAVEAFNIMQYFHLPNEMAEFDKSFFESKKFIIPDKYILKEVAPVKDNSDEDDSESTHPSTVKRKALVQSLIVPSSGKAKFLLDEKRFNYIRELSRFEMCRLYLRYRDYNAALYSAYVLAKKYPDNLFLIQTISKCLYAISLYNFGYLRYNKDSFLDGPIHYMQVESHPQRLYYLINKMPESEWNIMSLNYVYRNHKKFPQDKLLAAISDSLFKSMTFVNGYFETPKEMDPAAVYVHVESKSDTSLWYKNVFTDLFQEDKEFTGKFPRTIGNKFELPYTPKSYHKNRFEQKARTVANIGVVMCLKPLYLIFDEDEEQVKLFESEAEQKKLIQLINNCSVQQAFKLVVLDPGTISYEEVGKLNDYSVVMDWLVECSDGSDNEKLRVPVFNTSDLDDVVARYGTSHVLRTGVAVLDGKTKEFVFFAVIYDLKLNKQVYISQETIKGKPKSTVIQEKVCALFKELKYGK